MEVLQPYLEFLSDHIVTVVLITSFIEAAGVPFPGRLLLIVAATLVADVRELVEVGAAAIVGSVAGDHIPYTAGYYVGPRLLDFYCRVTLGSERCVAQTLSYFQRFGAAAVAMGRFSTTVRLLAAALSGCGHISYVRFLLWDAMGTIVYAVVWASIGYLVGNQAIAFLERHGAARYLVLIIPVALVSVVAYRLWRRTRHGPAQPDALDPVVSACLSPTVLEHQR
jgi:membrane protein DedA with SNARE-associated domain